MGQEENIKHKTDDNTNSTEIKVFIGNTSIFDNIKIDEDNDKNKKISKIKEIISKALQIDNLNFLLGAGCSSYMTTPKICEECQKKYNFQCNKYNAKNEYYDCGIPVMSGLIQNFINKEKGMNILGLELNVDTLNNMFENNLEKLLEYLQSLELVISKLNNEYQIYYKKNSEENKVKPDDVEKNINKIKNFIIQEILNNKDTMAVLELYKLFYQKIINKNRKNPINIFTTNYDIYNETALDRLNFLYNNGFSGTVERRFNPMLYKYMFVENMNLNKDVWEPVSYFFNLIKLHGSITWEADKNTSEIYEKSNFDNLNNKQLINNIKKVMIYPSPLKDRSTLMTPYSDLFRFLENSLYLNNSTLIVIGYSFGDDHINRVIFNALANPTFRLIVFGINEHIKKLIERNDKRITVIYSENKEQTSNDNPKENGQNKQQNENQEVQQNNGEKQNNRQNNEENCKNTEYQPIHYFKYIVNNLLPSPNDDILEKDKIEKLVKCLLKEQTDKGNI